MDGFYELRDRGRMQPKGVEPMPVFELIGPGALETTLELAATRGFSQFVGREGEMGALEAAFARALEGQGSVVGVVAGPGLGKSRLCHEFAQCCRARGTEVYIAEGLAHARSVPFLPVLKLLRAQFRITDGDDPLTTRDKVAQAVLGLDASLDDALPLLWELLGVADPARPAMFTEPEARQRQLFGALARFGRARSAQTPIVVIVEDLHWLDPGSESFLKELVDGVLETRDLVVTTFRPGYRPTWAHHSRYSQLLLHPLADEAAEHLLTDLLGSHPSVDGVATAVRERTGGNPFFIEEVIRDLVEDGSLVGWRGSYELARTVDRVRIPDSVKAVLAARIDRLAPNEKLVLQTAAVVGNQFSRRVLGRLHSLGDDELDGVLRALVDAEFLQLSATDPEPEYTFRHGLTEEVAYSSQLARRGAQIHAAIGGILGDLDPDKLDERSALIARHHELGGELLEAARWNARAAGWLGFSHPLEAARHWRRVRALLDDVDATPETVQLGLNARLQLLNSHWRLGTAGEDGQIPYEDEAARLFAEAEVFADATGQAAMKAIAIAAYGAVQHLTDAPLQKTYDLLLRAARIADDAGEPGLQASVRVGQAWALSELGRVRDAAAVASEMAQIIGDARWAGRGLVVTSPYAWCRALGAFFTAHFERLDHGLAALTAAIDLAVAEDDDETKGWIHRCWAMLADLAGAAPDQAADHVLQGLRWADQAGSQYSRIVVRQAVAINHVQRQQWQEALATVADALDIVRSRRMGLIYVPLLLVTRGRAELGLGDLTGARSSATEATGLAVKYGTLGTEALARLQLTRALLAEQCEGFEVAARTELERALSIVRALDLAVYTPQIHLEQAHLSRAVGDMVGVERELATAHRLFLDVGAHGRAEEVASMMRSG